MTAHLEDCVELHPDFRKKADARRRLVKSIGFGFAFVGSLMSLSAFTSASPYSLLYFGAGVAGSMLLGAAFYFSACGESHVKEEIWWQGHATRLLKESSPVEMDVTFKSFNVALYRGAMMMVWSITVHLPGGRELGFTSYLDDFAPPGSVAFLPFDKTIRCPVRLDEAETTAVIELGELRAWCLRAGMTPGSIFQRLTPARKIGLS